MDNYHCLSIQNKKTQAYHEWTMEKNGFSVKIKRQIQMHKILSSLKPYPNFKGTKIKMN